MYKVEAREFNFWWGLYYTEELEKMRSYNATKIYKKMSL